MTPITETSMFFGDLTTRFANCLCCIKDFSLVAFFTKFSSFQLNRFSTGNTANASSSMNRLAAFCIILPFSR